jgi:hypothetical protein
MKNMNLLYPVVRFRPWKLTPRIKNAAPPKIAGVKSNKSGSFFSQGLKLDRFFLMLKAAEVRTPLFLQPKILIIP